MAEGIKSLILLLILVCPCFQAMECNKHQGMKELELQLFQHLKKYAEKLEDKINLIEESIAEYTEEIEEANQDPELYLSNPLNAFRLIRHMHQDWVSWQVYMEKQVAPEIVESIEHLLLKAPQKKDYKKAVEDVHELVRFYDYKPSDLVARHERNSSLHLSPLDCYDLGLERYEAEDYLGAAKWLTSAAENYTLSEYSELFGLLGAPRWQVYRDQARALLKLNRPSFQEAYEKASDLSPFNVHLMDEFGLWELTSMRDPMDPVPDPTPNPTNLEKHCRGPPKNVVGELNNRVADSVELPRLRFEQLLEPSTGLYPNSVHESELRHVEKAYHLCPSSNQFTLTEGTIVCTIYNKFSPTMQQIRDRVLEMTGMTKAFQISYVLEYNSLWPLDFHELFREIKVVSDTNLQSVVATAFIFLRNLTEGGAITMPNHGVYVQPKRGNVLTITDAINMNTTFCPNVEGSGLVMLQFLLEDEIPQHKV